MQSQAELKRLPQYESHPIIKKYANSFIGAVQEGDISKFKLLQSRFLEEIKKDPTYPSLKGEADEATFIRNCMWSVVRQPIDQHTVHPILQGNFLMHWATIVHPSNRIKSVEMLRFLRTEFYFNYDIPHFDKGLPAMGAAMNGNLPALYELCQVPTSPDSEMIPLSYRRDPDQSHPNGLSIREALENYFEHHSQDGALPLWNLSKDPVKGCLDLGGFFKMNLSQLMAREDLRKLLFDCNNVVSAPPVPMGPPPTPVQRISPTAAAGAAAAAMAARAVATAATAAPSSTSSSSSSSSTSSSSSSSSLAPHGRTPTRYTKTTNKSKRTTPPAATPTPPSSSSSTKPNTRGGKKARTTPPPSLPVTTPTTTVDLTVETSSRETKNILTHSSPIKSNAPTSMMSAGTSPASEDGNKNDELIQKMMSEIKATSDSLSSTGSKSGAIGSTQQIMQNMLNNMMNALSAFKNAPSTAPTPPPAPTPIPPFTPIVTGTPGLIPDPFATTATVPMSPLTSVDITSFLADNEDDKDDDVQVVSSHVPNPVDLPLLKKEDLFPSSFFTSANSFTDTPVPPTPNNTTNTF